MESYSHSQSQHFKPQSTSIPHTFSTNGNKKPPTFPINNGGFFSTSYDDVFGGPPKYSTLAPRAEDYSEIFGAFRTPSSSRASSIPVLDLPPVSDIISGGSVFDYSDVFADFDTVGFAVSYDQLFPPFDAGHGDGDGDGCSSDEAWTPVGTESLSDDSDPFASSEKSQCFSNENSHQPLDNKQFSVSYHKFNVGTSTCIPNMTHVAQLNAVPGYTCVVEETSSPREMGAERLSTAEVDDIVFSVDSSSILPEKHERKTMSEMSLDDTGVKSSDGDHVLVGARATSMSHVDSTVASASDINLATQSLHFPPLSRLPPLATERKEAISRSSGLISTDDCSLEVTHDNRLPPCFDMEVDASSFASASAAAMKDAMEKAQAKLKAANVLMNRKKDGLQDIADLGLKTVENGGNNVQTAFNDCAYGDNRLQTESGRGPAKMMSSQSLPDMSAVEQPNFVIEKPAEGKHEKKCSLSMNTAFTEGDGEWKKATQYYEFVTSDSSRVVPKPPSYIDGKISSSMQQSDDDHNSESDGEVCVPEGNRPRLKTIKSVSRQEYYEKMFKVAQDVHDSVIGGYVNYDHRPTGMLQGNHEEQKRKLGYESEKNAAIKIGRVQQVREKNSGEATSNEELKIKSKNELGNKEINMKGSKKKETEACHLEQSDQKTYGLDQGRVKESPEIKEEKRRMKELYERVESCCSVEEIVGGAENEKKTPEAYEKQRIKNKLADAVEQKKGKEQRDVKEKRSKEPFENGFGGKGLQTASESQETGKTKDLKRKVEDERSKRAFMDVFGGERLERTCEFRENDNKIGLLFRNEDGIFVEVAVDGQGSERIQEECIEMGKHWKYEDAPEQLIGRQRHRQNECHKPASGNKKSGEDLHLDNNEERLKKLTEHGSRDKPMQVNEMDEVVKVLKKTGVAENQKFVSGSHVIMEWEDEDQESERSSEIELLVENECLKPSGRTNLHERNVKVEPNALTSKFKSPRTEADGGQYVCAHKQNDEVSDVACNKQSNLKAVDTADVLVDEKPTESFAAEMGVVDHKDERTVHVVHSFDRNDSNSKSGELCNRNRQQLKNKNEKVSQPVPNPALVKDSDIEQAGRTNLGDGHVLSDQKQKVKSTPAEGISRWNEDERAKNKEAAQVVLTKWKENIQKNSHLPNVNQSTEQKGKISDQNCSLDEKIENKEKDFKKEQLRKLEEERERQREREKDRMAVEIAIREAQERAFADARDQVERNALERSADEARQRMMNEARERLEKACAEARERSLADKASEARLRADRVAVERATAEARQRAIEKAMAERATFEARERMQRSISEKYMSERDVVTRQSSMPSMHSEEFEAGDGEPAQRCKARLERHRRTVERVAKALAEKNMRDLLAQKEQAERSRLAETLDADIKRWSNGKEGNLRALLSTLQYILGPDSGWQPIPLTEVITAAAVKKAYRKATLCVHPDKLQQRGASIQHKYICEKVFDLLKEAWNRFNSEEK